MKKNSCGMVSFKDGEEDLLFICNGAGLLCTAGQEESLYIPWKDNPDYGWTNEVHLFSINEGKLCYCGDFALASSSYTLSKIRMTTCICHLALGCGLKKKNSTNTARSWDIKGFPCLAF